MSTFISKLQYKHYEKGEFTDEQPRNLQQTLELIRNYPWDQQSGADVQPTGPSVTIQNEKGEYLKLGRYFGGKFALYLYDNQHHLSELHEPTLDEACHIVELFFSDAIDKSIFHRHYLALSSEGHFDTRRFIYQQKKNSGPCLEISRGRDDFYYGLNEKNIVKFSKKEIKKLSIVAVTKFGQRHAEQHYEITFKDGLTISIPDSLIGHYTFGEKFPNLDVQYETRSWLWG